MLPVPELDYFFVVSGISGDSLDKQYSGWFEVDGFELDLTNSGSFVGGGAAAPGLARFRR